MDNKNCNCPGEPECQYPNLCARCLHDASVDSGLTFKDLFGEDGGGNNG